MISRTCRGVTAAGDADAYGAYLDKGAILRAGRLGLLELSFNRSAMWTRLSSDRNPMRWQSPGTAIPLSMAGGAMLLRRFSLDTTIV